MAVSNVARWVRGALAYGSSISQAELARALGKRLRRDYDRSMVQKMAGGDSKVSAEEMLAIEGNYRVPGTGQALSKVATVPEISWVSAGKLADTGEPVPTDEAKTHWIADLGAGDYFALRVVGDSMDRVSPDGSVIIVDRADRELVPGKYYVFSLRGEATFKTWEPRPPHFAPYSTNHSNKPEFLGKRDFIVVGRVRRTLLDL